MVSPLQARIDHILTTPEHQKSREAYWGSCMVLPTSEIRKALVLGDGTLDVQVTLTSPGFLWTTKTLLHILDEVYHGPPWRPPRRKKLRTRFFGSKFHKILTCQ